MTDKTTLRDAELEIRNNRMWFDRMCKAYLGVSLDELVCHQKCSQCKQKGACGNAASDLDQAAKNRFSNR